MRLKLFVLYCVQNTHEVYDRDPAQNLRVTALFVSLGGYIYCSFLSSLPCSFWKDPRMGTVLTFQLKWTQCSMAQYLEFQLLGWNCWIWTNPFFSESFSLCVEWSNRITSIYLKSVWISDECGQAFFIDRFHRITAVCQSTCPILGVLMKNLKRYWELWTCSRFPLFHQKIPFQVLSDLLSPNAAKVLLRML